MTVADLKHMLNEYPDDAEIRVVDFTNGRTYDLSVGSDDEDEGETACTFSFE